jgi:hypothetical protein
MSDPKFPIDESHVSSDNDIAESADIDDDCAELSYSTRFMALETEDNVRDKSDSDEQSGMEEPVTTKKKKKSLSKPRKKNKKVDVSIPSDESSIILLLENNLLEFRAAY